MTKLKLDIKFNSSCTLTVNDTTGFIGGAITDGFTPESGTPAAEGDYKISDGYFINALIYHKFYGPQQVINTSEGYRNIPSGTVSPTYANNFTPFQYKLEKDGVYSFRRLFVISKAYYLANAGEITKTVVYYDNVEDKFIKIVAGEPTELTFADLVESINTNTTGSVVTYKFVTTCYLNKCLYLLQNEVLNKGIGACHAELDNYRKQRDYITMTLNIIKYLKDDGHLTEVQRIIEVSDSCGMICKQIGRQTNNDCGCG